MKKRRKKPPVCPDSYREAVMSRQGRMIAEEISDNHLCPTELSPIESVLAAYHSAESRE